MEENNHPQGFHENTDVDTWAVGKFGIALALTCLLSLAVLFGMFRFFQSVYGDPSRRKAVFDPQKVFPQPQLEAEPRIYLDEIREAQRQTLDSYGWVDKPNGVVRVPIDRAMELLLKRGLPARSSAPAAPDVSRPTDSSLGTKQ